MKKTVLTTMTIGILAANSSFAAVPTSALTFDTNVTTYSMTSSQEAKIQKAEEKIKDVIGSEEFRTAVLNHTYLGRKQFKDNGGLTNSEIYTKILNGAERLTPTKDNEMDLKIKVYYENSNTVGFTSSSSSYINMNTKYLNGYTSNEVAKTMMHEWLHKMSFHHAASYSTSRNYSVPYAIGSIVMKLAAKY